MISKKNGHSDIAVIGTGPIGMLTALNLVHEGYSVSLIGLPPHTSELRTSALMMPAIRMLQKLNIWDIIKCHAAALSSIRIIDATSRIIRSPTISFYSSEINEEFFGYNIPNSTLNNALMHAITHTPGIAKFPSLAKFFHHQQDHVCITLSDGQLIQASLIIAADGRNSLARQAAGINVKQWNYPQTALILNFLHTLPHNNISNEFHTKDGPFTQVPLPGNKSSLVWVSNLMHAKELLNMKSEVIAKIIEDKMQSMLGKITVDTAVQAYPLSGLISSCFAANRTILVGEAAHVFPPIGAQGLNLGFRDVQTLIDILSNKISDFNPKTIISYYNRYRKPDIFIHTASIHALNCALLSNMFPIHIMRSIGFELLRNFSPLRNFFMREGIHPGYGLKELIIKRILS
ncbi:UbiH/UbiF family hydroxylase [Bartonella bacilliformis]|uniref:FAD-binding domain-containing protein n=1 Tax=Bartonella bacilliformis Ver097 TaxID=1293911 RepID=A0A072R3C3_BARBA|nr:UbiH/UbiF family hydroxylase [Bartonella bacilliformis]KEG19687.1 hypothetical protein H710_00902 [Bartonella bacilliformis Ver097]